MTEKHSKRLLLCVTGLTPQVVTENLYALQNRDENWPDEVHLLSTAEGIERARLTLLSEDPGWFRRLCRDYRRPVPRFEAECLHVLTDRRGRPLHDIRDAEDNVAAADGITECIRRLTADRESALHVSLAGGRKTMGFFAGYALSLFGRPQDRLSHVLVDAPFESHPEFFYPTPYAHVIYAPPPDQKPLDTSKAQVTLADIPFVRLRHGLPEVLLSGRGSFSETVGAAQRAVGPTRLQLDLPKRRISAGGVVIPLPPAELAFYAWLARRVLAGQEPIPCPPEGVPDGAYAVGFLREYRAIIGELGDDERVVSGLRQGMDKGYFLSHRSKLNQRLKQALGFAAGDYEVRTQGRRPNTRYGLGLAAGQIEFLET